MNIFKLLILCRRAVCSGLLCMRYVVVYCVQSICVVEQMDNVVDRGSRGADTVLHCIYDGCSRL